MIVTAGSTNVSVYYYITGNAANASPGDPVTGLLFSDIETGGSASYVRQGAARSDLTLITLASASATHADGGFILVDDTNMKGVYRCDYPDAAFITGVDQVICSIEIATAKNAVAAPLLIDIMDVDLRDAVRGGMTALPNFVAGSAGGLPDDTDANGAVRVVSGTAAREISLTSGLVDLKTDALDSDSLAATAVTDIWAKVVESEASYTAQQAMSIILSVLAGETNTGGTVFRTPNDVSTRVTAVVDGSNNRTTMTLTPSA